MNQDGNMCIYTYITLGYHMTDGNLQFGNKSKIITYEFQFFSFAQNTDITSPRNIYQENTSRREMLFYPEVGNT